MKLSKLTDPKVQNRSRYLKKKKKKKLFFNFLKITEFRNETFETYRSKGAKSKPIPKKKKKKLFFNFLKITEF
jgi:UDP-2,3-diacylglucosamine pyrophosphatase LpxH